jgi:hypothetical protein
MQTSDGRQRVSRQAHIVGGEIIHFVSCYAHPLAELS